jgi:hypothetical protein
MMTIPDNPKKIQKKRAQLTMVYAKKEGMNKLEKIKEKYSKRDALLNY